MGATASTSRRTERPLHPFRAVRAPVPTQHPLATETAAAAVGADAAPSNNQSQATPATSTAPPAVATAAGTATTTMTVPSIMSPQTIASSLLSGSGPRRPTRNALESMVSSLSSDLDKARSKLSVAERELEAATAAEQQQKGSLPHTECIVCMNAQVSTVLLPCGHLCLCGPCSTLMQQSKKSESVSCPMCRQPVKQVHRVYLPIEE